MQTALALIANVVLSVGGFLALTMSGVHLIVSFLAFLILGSIVNSLVSRVTGVDVNELLFG